MDMMKQYDEILEKALALGKEKHPDAPAQHCAAFANSVACAMTGLSGGYGGPSMREHWAERIAISTFGMAKPMALRCTFEQAVELLDECCFGSLVLEQALMLREEEGHCFGDTQEDLDRAEELLRKANW